MRCSIKMGIKRFGQGMGIVAAAAAVICSVCFVHGADVAVKGMKHSNRNEIRPYVSMADAFVQGDSMVYADGWYGRQWSLQAFGYFPALSESLGRLFLFFICR